MIKSLKKLRFGNVFLSRIMLQYGIFCLIIDKIFSTCNKKLPFFECSYYIHFFASLFITEAAARIPWPHPEASPWPPPHRHTPAITPNVRFVGWAAGKFVSHRRGGEEWPPSKKKTQIFGISFFIDGKPNFHMFETPLLIFDDFFCFF